MWNRRGDQVRSSGWSGAEEPIVDVLPGFDLGRRSGMSESLEALRSWHQILVKDLSERPSDVFLQIREQTVRLAISKVMDLI